MVGVLGVTTALYGGCTRGKWFPVKMGQVPKKKEKNGVLMFNRLWFPEITDMYSDFIFQKHYNRVWLSLCKKICRVSICKWSEFCKSCDKHI